MPMRCCWVGKLWWGAVVCGLVSPLGCASWRGDRSPGEVAEVKPHPSPKGMPALAQATTKKAATKASPAATPAAAHGAVDTKSLQEVLAGMDELDPATRQKMLDQLADADPALLGPTLEQWKAVIAAKRRRADRDALVKSGVQDTGTAPPAPIARSEPAAPAKPEAANFAKPEAAGESEVVPAHRVDPPDDGVKEREPAGRIETAARQEKPAASDSAAHTNQPSGLTASQKARPAEASWQSMLADVIAQAEKQRVSAAPGNTQEEVYLRLLQIMHGDTEKALAPIAGASAAEQEFWQKTLWAMANYFDSGAIPNPSDRAAETVLHLNEAISRLRASAALQVKNLAFCRKILSYGSVEKFTEYEFTPGQPVLLYAEVENFTSQQTPQGYKTVLKSSLEIQDMQGNQVWPQDFKVTEDLCRNLRRDYFHSYQFTLPAKINAGSYVLKLTVEDELAHKVAAGSLKFSIK